MDLADYPLRLIFVASLVVILASSVVGLVFSLVVEGGRIFQQ